ncbi:MAG: UDP-N-acetylmuramoylalanyl-D-glutamate-2, 6-diaminopimelate ligase [Candidatus Yanofskybacteria bacterium GW2011_GWA1_48_10]|uniref:UDP-N-acetylmuramoylalanyl-D-glutamate-2, 6-diaminopimelate ligase n=3 Tax=Parcubacteria group TaxID=1794811 RepID=A0A0G1U7F0_9BACT|nr:MAG: UDP-N-acetylmuramoylalanyl-D-glutamate-2, 6-diaminopimelate ligase [Candidatus Nomurabacteria bacterium GW2011_GWB1_47_6]KKU90052.1 MAG: UDP-N-acetylmuramoylalanyl-D-glutamate-2, 6-diaminopimelate ligase [Candidatus Yanofskybacteria bacterium GW2011_GWA1_48_10]OGN05972.1 MAG: hypothetical protein A2669_01225 [Candidatus Yanofskybacteria bacterium RIFCSPHIGHO2_01_FULL_48_25b]
MIKESLLDKILYEIKKFIPKRVFNFFRPAYHWLLAQAGPIRYGFPSRNMRVIGVTGTKGKSTTVYMITKILESAGHDVAAIGSLGFKIKNREWPNTLKMTMPGRFRLQKFLHEAQKAGCQFVVLEVTSEGITEYRHLGIKFDCAVFTNIHKEHLESHGSFDNYLKCKQELFRIPKRLHVLNADDAYFSEFDKFQAKEKIAYGLRGNDIRPEVIQTLGTSSEFKIASQVVNLNLGGEFNILNAAAAWAVAAAYGVSSGIIVDALSKIKSIPGRLEFIQREPFGVVVDYAHTPDSLEAVYKTLKPSGNHLPGKLICVLGAAGGGRDKWKRPEFGAIADRWADEIILTDEDPYEENPEQIISQIKSGIKRDHGLEIILDREKAIGRAIGKARNGDVVVITGKGSEISMAVAGNKKIPWSDREIALKFLAK